MLFFFFSLQYSQLSPSLNKKLHETKYMQTSISHYLIYLYTYQNIYSSFTLLPSVYVSTRLDTFKPTDKIYHKSTGDFRTNYTWVNRKEKCVCLCEWEMKEQKNEGIAFVSNFVSIKQQVLKKKLCESVKILIDLSKEKCTRARTHHCTN